MAANTSGSQVMVAPSGNVSSRMCPCLSSTHPEPEPSAVFARRLEFPGKGSLYVIVSEAAYPSTVTISEPSGHIRYRLVVPPTRAVLFAVDVHGQLVAVYGPKDQRIETLS